MCTSWDSWLFSILITSITVHRSLKELWPHWRGNDWKKIVIIIFFKHEKHASFELRINIIRYLLSLRFSSIYDPKKTLLERTKGTWLVEMPSVLPEARMVPCKAPQHPQGLRIWETLSLRKVPARPPDKAEVPQWWWEVEGAQGESSTGFWLVSAVGGHREGHCLQLRQSGNIFAFWFFLNLQRDIFISLYHFHLVVTRERLTLKIFEFVLVSAWATKDFAFTPDCKNSQISAVKNNTFNGNGWKWILTEC